MHFYLDPEREKGKWSLPDAEVFYSAEEEGEGYYWWVCFPGCMPEGDKSGPFKTQEEAISDAREVYQDF